jgi:hypothetical protein
MSESTEIRVTEAKAGLYSRIIFALFCMVTGAGAFIWGIVLDTRNEAVCGPAVNKAFWTLGHILMVGGAVWAVFGGMILPSVFDAAKPVITFAFPNGLPWVGGRRLTDPPKQDAPKDLNG